MKHHYKVKGEKMRRNVSEWTLWFQQFDKSEFWFIKKPSTKKLRKFFIRHYDKLIELHLDKWCSIRAKSKVICVGELNNFLVEHHILRASYLQLRE